MDVSGPVFGRRVGERSSLHAADDIDEDVEAVEVTVDRGEELGKVVGIQRVGDRCGDAAAQLLDLGRAPVQGRGIDVAERDIKPRCGEGLRHRGADTLRAADDRGDLALQVRPLLEISQGLLRSRSGTV